MIEPAVRPADPRDVAALIDLGAAMHRESVYRRLPYDAGKVRAMLDRYLARPAEACVLVAARADEIVGMLGGYLDEHFFCDVTVASDTFFYVTPAARGRGVGSRLLGAFMDWASARGAATVSLAVTSGIDDDIVARRYAALGFVPAGYLYRRELG